MTWPVASGSGIQDDNKYHAIASKSNLDVKEFKATITTEPISLPAGTNAAFSLISVGTWNIHSGFAMQAQMGYGKQREAGSTNIQEFVYAEVYKKNASTGEIIDWFIHKQPGYPSGTNEYKGVLNTSNGTWTFYLNGTSITNSGPKDYFEETGETMFVQSEIFNKYSQGAGSSTNKVSVTNAQWRNPSGTWTSLSPSGSTTNHPDLNVQVPGAGEVNFWDSDP